MLKKEIVHVARRNVADAVGTWRWKKGVREQDEEDGTVGKNGSVGRMAVAAQATASAGASSSCCCCLSSSLGSSLGSSSSSSSRLGGSSNNRPRGNSSNKPSSCLSKRSCDLSGSLSSRPVEQLPELQQQQQQQSEQQPLRGLATNTW